MLAGIDCIYAGSLPSTVNTKRDPRSTEGAHSGAVVEGSTKFCHTWQTINV